MKDLAESPKDVNVVDLAKRYVKARQDYLDSNAQTKGLGVTQKELEEQLIKALVSQGLKSLRLEEIGVTVGYKRSKKVSCLNENMDLLLDWMREKGYGGLVKSKVDMRVLATTVKELEEAGVEIPEFIEQFDHLSASTRKI